MSDADNTVNVLLVEDYPANILIAETLLAEFGYTCKSVTCGITACEAVQKQHYPIILMDINMPDMDGYQATKKIREFEHSSFRKPAHIIAMTAHSAKDTKMKSIEYGMDDYITKPFDVTDLQDKLNAASQF